MVRGEKRRQRTASRNEMSLLVGLFTVTRTTMRERELRLFRLFDVPQPRTSYALV